KPDARLIKLLIKARRFNARLLNSHDVPFALLAKREGVSPSYFTRLVRLSYLAPDITEAILDGPAARSDHRQAAGTFTSATWLARAADRAWHYLSQTGLRAWSDREPNLARRAGTTTVGEQLSRHCGTGKGPDRDKIGSWCDVDEPCASLPTAPPAQRRTP